MYQTESYVQRKNYMNSEAGQFNGDKAAAERSYLQEGYNRMKNSTISENESLKSASQSYSDRIEILTKLQKQNPGDPQTAAALRELTFNKNIVDQNLENSNQNVSYYKNSI